MPRGKRVLEDSDGEEPQYSKKAKPEKAGKAKKELGKGQDADGNTYWEVGSCAVHRSALKRLLDLLLILTAQAA